MFETDAPHLRQTSCFPSFLENTQSFYLFSIWHGVLSNFHQIERPRNEMGGKNEWNNSFSFTWILFFPLCWHVLMVRIVSHRNQMINNNNKKEKKRGEKGWGSYIYRFTVNIMNRAGSFDKCKKNRKLTESIRGSKSFCRVAVEFRRKTLDWVGHGR